MTYDIYCRKETAMIGVIDEIMTLIKSKKWINLWNINLKGGLYGKTHPRSGKNK